MKKFIHTVTVTGADDSVTINELRDIQDRYPFVEFGILLSVNQIGLPLHPSAHWLDALIDTGDGLHLSGHLCGRYARRFLTGMLDFDQEFSPVFCRRFTRWQINTRGMRRDWSPEPLMEAVNSLFNRGQEVIFQYDGVNTQMVRFIAERSRGNVSALFDFSHGTGLLPSSWPSTELPISVGFAGGLSPDNLDHQIEAIYEAAKGQPVWIDAQARLRSNNNVQFNLELVAKFLETAKPYVAEEAALSQRHKLMKAIYDGTKKGENHA